MTVVTSTERKIVASQATNTAGVGSAVINVSGEIHSVHICCPTTGAYITLDELVEQVGPVCITGDSIVAVVVTGNLLSIHPKVPAHVANQAVTIANEYTHPHVDKVKFAIASGGNTKTTYVNILTR